MKVKVRKRKPAPVAAEQVKENAITHKPQNQAVINNLDSICVNISLSRMLKNAYAHPSCSNYNIIL